MHLLFFRHFFLVLFTLAKGCKKPLMIIVEQANHELLLQELAAAYGGYLKFRFRSQYGNFYELKLGLQPEEHRTDWFPSPPARFHWIMQINTYTYTHTRTDSETSPSEKPPHLQNRCLKYLSVGKERSIGLGDDRVRAWIPDGAPRFPQLLATSIDAAAQLASTSEDLLTTLSQDF